MSDEPARAALDLGIAYLDSMRVAIVREDGGFRVEDKAGRLPFLADSSRVDPMQRLGFARAGSVGSGVIDDDLGPVGLHALKDRTIEGGCRRTPGLDQLDVKIVAEQVQP